MSVEQVLCTHAARLGCSRASPMFARERLLLLSNTRTLTGLTVFTVVLPMIIQLATENDQPTGSGKIG